MSKNQIAIMADRLNIDEQDMHNIVVNTVMPARTQVSNEQFVLFMAVANEYKLNPLCKEIYAFPTKGGGIQPIVSIDGWLNIINSQPQYDGMDIEFATETITLNNKQVPEWCKVKIYRKDRSRPTEAIEYMDECYRATEPWEMKPRRMLQHKACIQAGRYAFGISGIIDEDEKEAYKDAGVIREERDITPQPEQPKPTTAESLFSQMDASKSVQKRVKAQQQAEQGVSQHAGDPVYREQEPEQDVSQETEPTPTADELAEQERNAKISAFVEGQLKAYDEAAGYPDKQKQIVELTKKRLVNAPHWMESFKQAIA